MEKKYDKFFIIWHNDHYISLIVCKQQNISIQTITQVHLDKFYNICIYLSSILHFVQYQFSLPFRFLHFNRKKVVIWAITKQKNIKIVDKLSIFRDFLRLYNQLLNKTTEKKEFLFFQQMITRVSTYYQLALSKSFDGKNIQYYNTSSSYNNQKKQRKFFVNLTTHRIITELKSKIYFVSQKLSINAVEYFIVLQIIEMKKAIKCLTIITLLFQACQTQGCLVTDCALCDIQPYLCSICNNLPNGELVIQQYPSSDQSQCLACSQYIDSCLSCTPQTVAGGPLYCTQCPPGFQPSANHTSCVPTPPCTAQNCIDCSNVQGPFEKCNACSNEPGTGYPMIPSPNRKSCIPCGPGNVIFRRKCIKCPKCATCHLSSDQKRILCDP